MSFSSSVSARCSDSQRSPISGFIERKKSNYSASGETVEIFNDSGFLLPKVEMSFEGFDAVVG